MERGAPSLFPVFATKKAYNACISDPISVEDNGVSNELQEVFNVTVVQENLTVVECRSFRMRLLTAVLERKQCKARRGRPVPRAGTANDETAALARKLNSHEKYAMALCDASATFERLGFLPRSSKRRCIRVSVRVQ